MQLRQQRLEARRQRGCSQLWCQRVRPRRLPPRPLVLRRQHHPRRSRRSSRAGKRSRRTSRLRPCLQQQTSFPRRRRGHVLRLSTPPGGWILLRLWTLARHLPTATSTAATQGTAATVRPCLQRCRFSPVPLHMWALQESPSARAVSNSALPSLIAMYQLWYPPSRFPLPRWHHKWQWERPGWQRQRRRDQQAAADAWRRPAHGAAAAAAGAGHPACWLWAAQHATGPGRCCWRLGSSWGADSGRARTGLGSARGTCGGRRRRCRGAPGAAAAAAEAGEGGRGGGRASAWRQRGR